MNMLAVLNKPSNSTKPPVTFYDAMRAYMTGRQFVDVLSRNIDVMLDPRPPTPPAPTNPQPESEDPLAPPAQVRPPPFPSPVMSEGQIIPMDPTLRAVNAINDFTSILSNFGLRFGFTHWRDRFQRESAALGAQLYQRISNSAHASPTAQQMQAPVTFPPQWVPMPSVSPLAPTLMYGHPTTPPSLFPQQHSPFSSSMSYNSTPYDQATSPLQGQDATTPNTQGWNATPSPQPMPDMPQPTEGRKRQAMVYGASMSNQNQHGSQTQSPGAGPPHTGDGGSWFPPQHSAHPSQTDVPAWTPQPVTQAQDNIAWHHVPTTQGDASNWHQNNSQGNWG